MVKGLHQFVLLVRGHQCYIHILYVCRSPRFINFIEMCLLKDPSRRPTSDELLKVVPLYQCTLIRVAWDQHLFRIRFEWKDQLFLFNAHQNSCEYRGGGGVGISEVLD